MLPDLFFSMKRPSRALYVVGYHDVFNGDTIPSPFRHTRISTHLFEKHIQFYKRHFNILNPVETDLSGVVHQAKKPNLLVTFDDGYRSYLSHALPILCKYDVPSVNFLISDTIMDESAPPWDYVLGYLLKIGKHSLISKKFDIPAPNFQTIYMLKTTWHPKELTRITREIVEESGIRFPHWFLSKKDIKEINDKYGAITSFGSHTANHANCSKLGEDELHDEIIASHNSLEKMISGMLPLFSFPFGSAEFYTDSILNYLSAHSSLVLFGLGKSTPTISRSVLQRFNGDQQNMFNFYRQIYRIW